MPHTALLLAAKQGYNECIGLLVKHGFDVNRKLPGNSGTALHEAALYGKVDTVRYLLQASVVLLCLCVEGVLCAGGVWRECCVLVMCGESVVCWWCVKVRTTHTD